MFDQIMDWLQQKYSAIRYEIQEFPGGKIATIEYKDTFLEIQHHKSANKLGISEITDETIPFEPHDFYADNFTDAANFLDTLLDKKPYLWV